MIEVSYKNIGEDELENLYMYVNSERGAPQISSIPEEIDILDAHIVWPKKALYFIRYLQGGIRIGEGWRDSGAVYDDSLLVRLAAYNKCSTLGTPAWVLVRSGRNKLEPVCLFYKEDEKVYASIPLKDNKILRQEVLGNLEEGRELTIERLEDLERRLGS